MLGQSRQNESGTLLEGIAIWGELKPEQTVEKVKERALKLMNWSIARECRALDRVSPMVWALWAAVESAFE